MSATAWALVAVNLLPLYGVLQLGWKVNDVLFLFWMENLVIGLLHIARILLARPELSPGYAPRIPYTPVQLLAGKAILAAFFAVHYGFFWWIHGTFLTVFFASRTGSLFAGNLQWISEMLREAWMPAALGALAASHLFSLAFNYLGRGEYKRVDVKGLMTQPYHRVVVLHLYIIFGGTVLVATQSPTLAIALFVLIKIVADVMLHRREHRLPA